MDQDAIPLGLGNWLLAAAVSLWVVGALTRSGTRNPFRSFTVFVIIAGLWVGVAVLSGLAPDVRDILTPAKEQLSLLLLYYLPLATLRHERDFRIVMGGALLVHAAIGLEVARSGVLGGAAFNDSKRGSGPFGEDFRGSDIAGGYLAQTVMLPIGILLGATVPVVARAAALGATGLMVLGIFASYSRGSVVAAAAGLLMMVAARGIRVRIIALAVVVLMGGLYALPGGLRTRFDNTVSDEGALDESSRGRLVYYEAAWQIFKEHPLGVGTGQVRGAMGQHLEKVVDPHNAFLQTLVEYGVVGLPVLLVALAVMTWSALTLCRDRHMPWTYRAYALGMVGFLSVLAACNMFYSNLYKNTVLGTVAMHLGTLAWIHTERRRLTRARNQEAKQLRDASAHA